MGIVKTIHIFLFWNIGKQIIAPFIAAMYFNHIVYDLMLLQSCDINLRIQAFL